MLSGVLVVNKPQEMTSHDVVSIMRRQLKTKKVGHTGTLDPMATGVLPMCVGNATKIVDYLMDQRKVYVCEMVLGYATDTQDVWGNIIERGDATQISPDQVKAVLASFVGRIMQIPPMFSALKVNGQKLVDLARQGIIIEREAREREIFSIRVLKHVDRVWTFEVECSKGTYIRTLCHDIGLKLGCYATMQALKRTASTPFTLNHAVDVSDICMETFNRLAISIEEALAFMPPFRALATEKQVRLIENGVKLNFLNMMNAEETDLDQAHHYYRIYVNDVFYGVGERDKASLLMKKMMRG